MKVVLANVGNIDFGQDPTRPIYGTKNEIVEVSSLTDASKMCSNYILQNDLGSGNWCGGYVFDENTKQIAYISYNGRIWLPKDEYFIQDKKDLFNQISSRIKQTTLNQNHFEFSVEITTEKGVSQKEIRSEFEKWVSSNGWTFGGSIRKMNEEELIE